MVEEATTYPISEKRKIDTVKKTEKLQASKKTVEISKRNKTDTVKTKDKSRFIPGNNLSNRSTRIEKLKYIDMVEVQ